MVLVFGKKDTRYGDWKEMLEEHHYLRSAKLYGQQIKYLIESTEVGWIGAMAFSSAAWRLRYLTMVGRQRPEVDSDLLFNEQEREVLELIKYEKEYPSNTRNGLSLREAILIIAIPGGFVKGKGRDPGVEVMWREVYEGCMILQEEFPWLKETFSMKVRVFTILIPGDLSSKKLSNCKPKTVALPV